MPAPDGGDERGGEAGRGSPRTRLDAALRDSSTSPRTASEGGRIGDETQSPRQRLVAARLRSSPPRFTADTQLYQELVGAPSRTADPRPIDEETLEALGPPVDGDRISPGSPSSVRPGEGEDRPVRRRRIHSLMGAALLAVAVVVLGALALREYRPESASPRPEQREGLVAAQAVPFAPPVTLVPGESYVRTTVRPDGTLSVSHWVMTERLVTTVSLSGPEALTVLGNAVAVDMRVVADDAIVPGPTTATDRTVSFQFDPSRKIQVDYVLEGVTERSGSVPGRALTRAASLVVGIEPPPVQVTQSIGGVQVLSVACVSASAAMTPCGRAEEGVWYVEFGGDTPPPVIISQVNLSPGSS